VPSREKLRLGLGILTRVRPHSPWWCTVSTPAARGGCACRHRGYAPLEGSKECPRKPRARMSSWSAHRSRRPRRRAKKYQTNKNNRFVRAVVWCRVHGTWSCSVVQLTAAGDGRTPSSTARCAKLPSPELFAEPFLGQRRGPYPLPRLIPSSEGIPAVPPPLAVRAVPPGYAVGSYLPSYPPPMPPAAPRGAAPASSNNHQESNSGPQRRRAPSSDPLPARTVTQGAIKAWGVTAITRCATVRNPAMTPTIAAPIENTHASG